MYNLPEQTIQEIVNILLRHSYVSADQDADESRNEKFIGADRTSNLEAIEQLENRAEKLEGLLSVLENGVRSHIASLRRRHNQLLPIYRLPFELLASIFQAVQGNVSEEKTYASVIKLSEVSSHWRKMVIAIPQLWTVMDCGDSSSWRELALERSRGLPLHIYCPWDAKGLNAFLDQVIPHMARWKTIKSYLRSFAHMISMYTGDLPLLDTFECPCTADDGLHIPQIVLKHASQLHTLDAVGYELSLEVGFGKLRALSFKASVAGVPLTSRQWELLLKSNQKLEYIYAEGPRPVTHGVLPVFHVRLPMLRHLSLDKLPQNSVNLLVSSIHPNFDLKPRLHINPPHYTLGSSGMFPKSPPDGSIWGSIYATSWMSLSEVTLGLRRLRAGIQQEENWLDLEERTPKEQASEMLKALTPPGGLPGLKSFTIGGGYILPNSKCIAQLSVLFPNLQHLVINYPTQRRSTYPGDVLAILSSPITPEDGSEIRWPVECLSVLSIDISGWKGFEEMMDFVECRYGVGSTCMADLVPLKVLRVTNLSGQKGRPSLDSGVEGELRALLNEAGAELEILVR